MSGIVFRCGHLRTEENSYQHRGCLECRICRAAKHKAWEVANPDKVAAKNKKYRDKNKEKRHAQIKEWKRSNSDRMRATRRAWNAAQREKGVSFNNYTPERLKALAPREKIAEVIEVIRSTASLEKVLEIMPRHHLAALRHFNPKLKPKLSIVRAKVRLAKIMTPDTIIAAPALAARSPAHTERVMQRCAAAVPLHFQRDLREDVVSDMVLAWWSGHLSERDIEQRAPKFISARFKSFHDKWGDLSLDVPVSEDSTTTRGELMRDDQRLWAQKD